MGTSVCEHSRHGTNRYGERLIKNNVDPLMIWIRESSFAAALNMKPPETPTVPPMPPA